MDINKNFYLRGDNSMKNRIIIKKSNNYIHFYLHCDAGQAYLFSERYHKGVYDYFCNGRSEAELRKYHSHNSNPRRDHTIAKCLMKSYRRAALEELEVA